MLAVWGSLRLAEARSLMDRERQTVEDQRATGDQETRSRASGLLADDGASGCRLSLRHGEDAEADAGVDVDGPAGRQEAHLVLLAGLL